MLQRRIFGLAMSGSALTALLAVILWAGGVGGETFLKVVAGGLFGYMAVVAFIASIYLILSK